MSARPPERLLTAHEVARLFHLHVKTVHRYRKCCGLPCIRVGGVVRFDSSQVARWLDSRREGQK